MAPKPKPLPEGKLGNWLKSIDKSTTRGLYRSHVPRLLRLAAFVEKGNVNGDQLIEDAQKDMDAAWDRLLSGANQIKSIHSRRVSLIGARRFLRAELPRKYRQLVPELEIKKPRRTKPSVFVPWEQMLQICDACAKPYNKIFRLMLHCAWGVSEFLTFNTVETWNDVKAKLGGNTNVDRYRFNFTGRKSNEREWYSLIPAAILKDILSSDVEVPFRAPRTQERMGKGGVLLDMTRYNSVRRYMASAFKTGYRRSAVKTQGVPSVHELRDTFRTRASECRVSPDVAEFAMGHAIDDLNYNKVFYDAEYVWSELKKTYGPTLVTETQLATRDARMQTLESENKTLKAKLDSLEGRFETLAKAKFKK